MSHTSFPPGTALIIGASRGLGLALVKEYLRREWKVIATIRDSGTAQHLFEISSNENLEIERLDIADEDQIKGLRWRLAGRKLDLLFVNAGVSNNPEEAIGNVSTEEFMRVMLTNALSPMRLVEWCADIVNEDGTVAVMSSILGSVSENKRGRWEAYRASKAALNTLMRSYVARHPEDPKTFLLVAPGWVRTELGGDDAPLDIGTSINGVVNAISARQGSKGLEFIDYKNNTLPW